jgi:hypothetical protein
MNPKKMFASTDPPAATLASKHSTVDTTKLVGLLFSTVASFAGAAMMGPLLA